MNKRMVGIGVQPVEMYPDDAFNLAASEADLKTAWQIIAPTVEFNINKVPIWKVFATVWLEAVRMTVDGLTKCPDIIECKRK